MPAPECPLELLGQMTRRDLPLTRVTSYPTACGASAIVNYDDVLYSVVVTPLSGFHECPHCDRSGLGGTDSMTGRDYKCDHCNGTLVVDQETYDAYKAGSTT